MHTHPTLKDYRTGAEMRYQIRRYLAFSDQCARAHGLEPRHHQALLALKGIPEGREPTIGFLAERLLLTHHGAVELVDRLEERGLVVRRRDRYDARRVFVKLTMEGEDMIERLALCHVEEFQIVGPALLEALTTLLAGK
jgi:DNA-binding MarR family transcriptional regulator